MSRVPYYFYFHFLEPFPKASFGDLELGRDCPEVKTCTEMWVIHENELNVFIVKRDVQSKAKSSCKPSSPSGRHLSPVSVNSMKQLGVFLFALDGTLVHHRFTCSIKLAS